MSALLSSTQSTQLTIPASQPKPTPAAANAAAASFAVLTAKLDYMSQSEVDNVRSAYRFADEAHLGHLTLAPTALSGTRTPCLQNMHLARKGIIPSRRAGSSEMGREEAIPEF